MRRPRHRLIMAAALFGLVVLIGLVQRLPLFASIDQLGLHIVAKLHGLPGAGMVSRLAGWLALIGEGGGRLFIALAIGLFLARAGRPRAVIWLIVAVGGVSLINPALKLLFAAPRPWAFPSPFLQMASGYSFPSGHAAGGMALYGALAALWPSRPIHLACAAMILAMGASRCWLGVHWPSDVLAGWIEGLAWLLLASVVVWRRPFAGETGTDIRT
jgi:undecaprenyl-diphosphatase